jgi:hypothetical protein
MGRPPTGIRPGERLIDYKRITIRVPPATADRLVALAERLERPQWRIAVEAIDAYASGLPPISLSRSCAEQHMPTTHDGQQADRNSRADNSVKRKLTYGVGGTDIVVGEFSLAWDAYLNAVGEDYQHLGGEGHATLSVDNIVHRVNRLLAVQPAELVCAELSDDEILEQLDDPEGGWAVFWFEQFLGRLQTWIRERNKKRLDRVARALLHQSRIRKTRPGPSPRLDPDDELGMQVLRRTLTTKFQRAYRKDLSGNGCRSAAVEAVNRVLPWLSPDMQSELVDQIAPMIAARKSSDAAALVVRRKYGVGIDRARRGRSRGVASADAPHRPVEPTRQAGTKASRRTFTGVDLDKIEDPQALENVTKAALGDDDSE